MLKAFRTLPQLKARPTARVVTYEDGESILEFYPPGGKYLGRQVVPADNKMKDGGKSFMARPSHIHLLQDEVFYVTQGEGLWYLRGQAPRRLKAGDTITIPQFLPHRFENVPGGTEPLAFDYNYDSSMREMEMRFFYNVFAYMDDCQHAKVPLSTLQLCVFCADCWMPVDLGIPGPNLINLVFSTLFMWIGAAIGRFVFGYHRTYPEYYQEEGNIFKKQS